MNNPSDKHRFQVDLRGLIDLLSHHLYSSPAVFVRELLQNAVDAIAARRQLDPAHRGVISVELIASEDAPTLIVHDNGVGLTAEEAHEFLATIGRSSKRGDTVLRPEDFLGRFGIGLLSGFLVTDEIVVITRSARSADQPTVEWRGGSDGQYSVRNIENDADPGTQVFLRGKPGALELFEPGRLSGLLRHYGEYLDTAIEFTTGDSTHTINRPAPWETDFADAHELERLVAEGETIFGRKMWDAIPLESSAGDVQGVAYVLGEATHAGAKHAHRVYLKKMLLSTRTENLLPDWAFFVQCVVNTRSLQPTASREGFYENDLLESARDQLGDCLRRYLMQIARGQPERLQHLISVHHLALKSLAIEDDECLAVFADWLPFSTTQGEMTFGEFRRQNPVVRYVRSLDQFRQISQVAASESLAVINAGYVYDAQILERIAAVRTDIQVLPFEVEELAERFEELTLAEREATIAFERTADIAMQRFKCAVELSKFRPAELPALFVTNENADFLRSVEQSQEVADDLWKGMLGSLAQETPTAYSRLHLNYTNPVVRKIAGLADRRAQQRCVEMLYVQSLLLGHFPLRQNEVQLLNSGLLGLLDWALDLSGENKPSGENDD
ncbi:HSP90 family protein [Lignipirellula cremea]|uniref:Chaperone protein HtpG n=1 Tax=Lignipirellula cremea TaxID=2528010 RepID=A0A518DV28_9BACT|nr:HSP90 family protein [Lignipirellula cremea]QDU95688.1 Chaperone protein HtpG [Lignipirellula cremea]